MRQQMPLSSFLTDVKQKFMNKQLAIIRGSRIDSSAENQTLNENFKRFTLQFKFNTLIPIEKLYTVHKLTVILFTNNI